jgi:hypothetical protein
MRRLLLTVIGLGVLAMLAGPPGASAQVPTQDSVVGTVVCPVGCPGPPPGTEFAPLIGLTADARSGPSGENPTGTMMWDQRFTGGGFRNATAVTCLSVKGNVAIVGVSGTRRIAAAGLSLEAWLAGRIRITDGGASGPDTMEFDLQQGEFDDPPPPPPPLPGPTDCSTFPAGSPADVAPGGELVVTDAPPLPTSKDQCQNGRWRNFPGFRNEGDCVSFVATHGKH